MAVGLSRVTQNTHPRMWTTIGEALSFAEIQFSGDQIYIPLTVARATAAEDALAKLPENATFQWIHGHDNSHLPPFEIAMLDLNGDSPLSDVVFVIYTAFRGDL